MPVAEHGSDKGPVCLYLFIFILWDRGMGKRTEHLLSARLGTSRAETGLLFWREGSTDSIWICVSLQSVFHGQNIHEYRLRRVYHWLLTLRTSENVNSGFWEPCSVWNRVWKRELKWLFTINPQTTSLCSGTGGSAYESSFNQFTRMYCFRF